MFAADQQIDRSRGDLGGGGVCGLVAVETLHDLGVETGLGHGLQACRLCFEGGIKGHHLPHRIGAQGFALQPTGQPHQITAHGAIGIGGKIHIELASQQTRRGSAVQGRDHKVEGEIRAARIALLRAHQIKLLLHPFRIFGSLRPEQHPAGAALEIAPELGCEPLPRHEHELIQEYLVTTLRQHVV